MKLHLGSGDRRIPGFINVDMRSLPNVDVVANVKYLHPRQFPQESADLIYASHVLEHFSKWEYESVLRRWYKILKPGGILRLAVPNFEMLAKWYLDHGKLEDIIGPLYGGQDYEGNFHYTCWDYKTLEKVLLEVGFKEVRYWDWRKTEHYCIDDNSQAYFPHMDKENGILESLNVEGIK